MPVREGIGEMSTEERFKIAADLAEKARILEEKAESPPVREQVERLKNTVRELEEGIEVSQ